MLFAGFVVAKGVPTLRHDWTWPIDRTAIASFFSDAINGWLSSGLGTPNPHPTTYLIGAPIAAAMWIAGPLAALALLAAIIGYASMRTVAAVAAHFGAAAPAGIGIGCFALFNPWVYNEVVAGHLVMVLAYAGFIGCCAEMLRGREASCVRLALWIALIESQLQFFIIAMLALVAFACATRKWLPPIFGIVFALPSIVGLAAERATLLRIPYSVEWQTNQSVFPVPLLGLGGYFPGYADRLGIAAPIAVWIVLVLAITGAILARRSRAVIWTFVAAVVVYVGVLGVHGPFAAAYAWVVRSVPESGVFRELYDLTGIFAGLLAVLACAATARNRWLGYAALAAGVTMPILWLIRPPSDLWIGSSAYPHPVVAAAPLTRVALLPAFQPLALRNGEGDGADPDAHVYPGGVATLNEYFPTYPVDMALARYEQTNDDRALRALGVSEILPRPWLVSKTRGGIGLAATSLEPTSSNGATSSARRLDRVMPLLSACPSLPVVSLATELDACDLFFGDAGGYAPLHAIAVPSDSIDPRSAWIDARLAFAEYPALAQGIGGALTESAIPQTVEPNAWLLAYVRGELRAGGRILARSGGAFQWYAIPSGVTSVTCAGLCELVVQTSQLPKMPLRGPIVQTRGFDFRRLLPWLYTVDVATSPAPVLRFNERYDAGWLALAGGRALRHVRIDHSVNGWFLDAPAQRLILVQVVALAQAIAEIAGVLCAIGLLKALARTPTKRA